LEKSKDSTYREEIQELVLSGHDSAIYLILMALKENPSAEGEELINLAKNIAQNDTKYSRIKSDSEPKKVDYIVSTFKFDDSFFRSFEQTGINKAIEEKYTNNSTTLPLDGKEILSAYSREFFFTPPRIKKPFLDVNYKNGSHVDSDTHFNIIDSISDIPCAYEEARIVKALSIDIESMKQDLNQVYPTKTRGINYVSQESLIQQINDYLSGVTSPSEAIKKPYDSQDLSSFDSIINIVRPKEKPKSDIETLIAIDDDDMIDVKLDITDLEIPKSENASTSVEVVKTKKIGFWKRLFGKKVAPVNFEETFGVDAKEVYQVDEAQLAEIKAKPREVKSFETELISEIDESEFIDESLFEVVQEPADFKIKPKSYYEEIQLVEALDSLDAITIDPNAKDESELVDNSELVGTIETIEYDADKELEDKAIGGHVSLSLGSKEYMPESEKIAGIQDLSPNVIDLTNLSKTKRKWWTFSKKSRTKEEVLEEVLKPAVAPIREVTLPEDAKEIFFPNKSNHIISEGLKLSLEEDEIKIDLSDSSTDRKIESDFIKEAIVINPEEAQNKNNQYEFVSDRAPEDDGEELDIPSNPKEEPIESTSEPTVEEPAENDKEKIADTTPLLPPRPEINSRQLIRDISIIDTDD
jgi:hypothetical protein